MSDKAQCDGSCYDKGEWIKCQDRTMFNFYWCTHERVWIKTDWISIPEEEEDGG